MDSALPQLLQNRLAGGLDWPHPAHDVASAVPHPLQNLAPGGFSLPQAEQAIARCPYTQHGAHAARAGWLSSVGRV